MMFYLIIISIILLVSLFLYFSSYIPYEQKKNILLVFAFSVLYFIHAFKDPYVFNDTPHYALAYDIMCKYGIIDFFKYANIKSTEFSYVVLMYLSSLVSKNTQFIFLVTSLLILSGYFYLIKKYSTVVWLSIFLFYISGFQMSLIVLRQFCALAILAYSVPYVIERNWRMFFLLEIVAIYFHFTSFVFIPLYFLYGQDLNESFAKKSMFLILIILSGLFFRAIYTYFGTLHGLGYESYLNHTGEGANNKMFFLLLFIFLLYIYSYRDSIFSDLINRLIFYLLFLGTFIAFFGIGLLATSRLNICYTTFAIILGIPKLIASDNKIVKYLAYILIFFLFINYCENLQYLENNSMVYKFCFS